MPSNCINVTYLDGKISSIRPTTTWTMGDVDIKSANWQSEGGYRSVYKCSK